MEVLVWQAREDKGLSVRQLAKLTGLSKSTINNIENGRTSPTLWQLEQLAKALDCKITYLFESEYK